MAIPYIKEFEFAYGEPQPVTPNVRRVVARNPSAFSFHGTGTYILGKGNVAIVDPGPDLADHVDALLNAVRGALGVERGNAVRVVAAPVELPPLRQRGRVGVGAT